MTKKKMTLAEKVNILRAGVLGANDGIVSVAGVVIGVAAATTQVWVILLSGLAAVFAGAFSMAGGEYVSVSTQRDTELALVNKLKSSRTMTESELKAILKDDYSLELGEYTNPWHAAGASFISFTIGAIFPMLSILLFPVRLRIVGTVILVALALALTGYVSARLGDAPRGRATMRNVCVGLLTMAVTYLLGRSFDL